MNVLPATLDQANYHQLIPFN